MSTPMKLKRDVDIVSQTALKNMLYLLDLELYAVMCVQVREELSKEIGLVDDRLTEQIEV
jgi:hypothetical protein